MPGNKIKNAQINNNPGLNNQQLNIIRLILLIFYNEINRNENKLMRVVITLNGAPI
jgi:hypothetical protein